MKTPQPPFDDEGRSALDAGPASFLVHHVQDCAVIAASGEIDLRSSPVLREVLLQATAQTCERVVLDLTHVSFLDSTGMSVLVAALHRCRHMSPAGTLYLVGLQPLVRRALDVTQLSALFPIVASVDEAIADHG